MNDNNQQTPEVVDTEILSTKNYLTKYGSQLAVVEKDFATLFEGSDMKKHLSSLKRKYSALKVKDVNDTETYEQIKKAISVVRPLRTAMDKKRKEVNKEAKSFIDSVNDMGAKIQAEIAKIEDPLWAEREKFEALQKEEAERAEKEAKERLDARVLELKENGLQFDGSGAYVINDINVSIQFISELPTEEYPKFLSKVREQNEANISEIKRKDEEAKEFQRIQDQLRLDNEAKQKALQAQEDAINAKLKAIADQEAELARKAQEQKEREELEAKQAKEKEERELLAEKSKRYEGLGFHFNYQNNVWGIKVGDYYAVLTKSDILNEEDGQFEGIKEMVDNATKREAERLAQEEADRQAKQKADAEELERKRIELQNDTEKFAEYLTALQAVPRPILSDTTLVSKLNAITNLINE